MIIKHPNYKNGYCLVKTSTEEDLQKLLEKYAEVKVVYCNSKTAKCFSVRDGYSPICINNKLNDGCFFINHLF